MCWAVLRSTAREEKGWQNGITRLSIHAPQDMVPGSRGCSLPLPPDFKYKTFICLANFGQLIAMESKCARQGSTLCCNNDLFWLYGDGYVTFKFITHKFFNN